MERPTLAAVAILALAILAGALIYLGEGIPVADTSEEPGTYRGVPHISGLGNVSLPLLATSVDDDGRLVADAEQDDPVTYCGTTDPPAEEGTLRFTDVEEPGEGPSSSFVEAPEGEPIDVEAIPEGNWSYAQWGEAEPGDSPLLFIVANRGLDHELATEGLIVFSAYSPYQCATVTIPGPGDPVPEPRAPRSVNLSALAFDATHFGFWYLDGLTWDRAGELEKAGRP